MENWVEIQKLKIEKHTDNYSLAKFNFLKISSLIRLVEESEHYAPHCTFCRTHLEQLETMIDQLPELDHPDIRKSYEQRFTTMCDHFRKIHGFYAPLHFSSRLSLISLIPGALAGLIFSLIVFQTVKADPILMASAAGLMIGYLAGNLKDKKIRREKKLI